MSAPFVVDRLTLAAQRRASDPQASAWVSANAGSGKTHVLAQRVKRLLLSGAAPEKILCLTFTKAAAGNMANRILNELAGWVRMDEADLRATLADLDGRKPEEIGGQELEQARRLFAKALETPGGLKIQTIHAFCDALLHQFPFEAGLAGSFQILDDLQRQALIDGAFEKALGSNAIELRNAFDRLVFEKNIEDLKSALLRCLSRLRPIFETEGGLRARVFSALEIAAGFSEADVSRKILDGVPQQVWDQIIAALRGTGAEPDANLAGCFARACAAEDDKKAQAYLDIFLTEEDEPRKASRFLSAGFKKNHPLFAENLLAELTRLVPLHEQSKLLVIAENTLAFLAIARFVWKDVEQAKAARGLLDYSDLIERADALLNGEGAAWVRYKLDHGIDHLLIDEAQDTSAAQWRVIFRLTQEFFAGQGARQVKRTVFAVGDDKQSIFSFQGAEPALFDEQRRKIASAAKNTGERFESVSLNLSFRSSPAILAAVDQIFDKAEVAAGVTSKDIFPKHVAAKKHLPGLVEIWPLETTAEEKQITGFTHPFLAAGESSAKARLARRIAREVSQETAASNIDAGDVLILVRTRNALFDALIRELKKAGIPVAGADRLILAEHIAAMDLMALGEAVLLPEDDLTFAALLKSPLFGLDDDDLFALAYKREASLHETLRRRVAEKPTWQSAYELFSAWRMRAKTCRPFEFFSQVLGADGGRQAFMRRLGREAGEVLDEFLNLALSFETAEIPTLQNFLSWLRAARVEIKRELQQGQNEVRVMTVHNAKGLEAKWIILADTSDMPGAKQIDDFYDAGSETGPAMLWAPGQKYKTGPLVRAKDYALRIQNEEYRRLLYVALTRAEQRLTLCGAQGKNKLPDDCWYNLAQQAWAKTETEERDEKGDILRWAIRHGDALSANRKEQVAGATDDRAPLWLHAACPPAVRRLELSPSRAVEESDIIPLEAHRSTGLARQKGVLLHRLLEVLPDLAAEARRTAAKNFLLARAPILTSNESEQLVEEALRVLALPQMQTFLQPNTLAEVPIAANIILKNGRLAVLHGSIDRLAIGVDAVHILDFKSGHAPNTGAVPLPYLSQLGLYKEALKPVAQDRPIRCYLLWTSLPRFDEVHNDAIEEALAKIA